jgi:predicted nuclease with TOPRIM domain
MLPMAESREILEEIEDEVSYCEKMLANETRLDLVIHILEEVQEKLKQLAISQSEAGERVKKLEERVNILYHRAKTLYTMGETTKSLHNSGFRL